MVASATSIHNTGWTTAKVVPERDSLGRNLIEYTTTGYVYISGTMNSTGNRLRVLCNTDTNPAQTHHQNYFMYNILAYPGYAPVNMQYIDPRGNNIFLPDSVPSDAQWAYTAMYPGKDAASNLYNNEKITVALWANSASQTPYKFFFACVGTDKKPTITKYIFVE